MDFEFNEEEKSVSELARKILVDLITNERLKDLEARAAGGPQGFDEEAYQALAESNLLGVAIPEEHGAP